MKDAEERFRGLQEGMIDAAEADTIHSHVAGATALKQIVGSGAGRAGHDDHRRAGRGHRRVSAF